MLVDTTYPGGFTARALRATRDLIRCDIAAINNVDPASGHFRCAVDPQDFPVPADAAATLLELADEHPLVAFIRPHLAESPVVPHAPTLHRSIRAAHQY